ncbi:uncharacterized protein (TIGR02118 family), partial [Tamaricihabitans halophyticus]
AQRLRDRLRRPHHPNRKLTNAKPDPPFIGHSPVSVKIVALLKAKPELSRAEFLYYWQQEHPAVVWTLPGLRAYHQSPAIEHHKPWPYDGMAELWFDSMADIRAAYGSPAADPVREHEKLFLGEVDWFVTTTTVVEPTEG